MPFNNMYFGTSKLKFNIFLLSALFIFIPYIASAGLGLLEDGALNSQETANSAFSKGAGFSEDTGVTTLPTAVALVINVFIGLLGTIFLVLIVISGWNWFTAQGDKAKIEKAKDRIINATIGLVIVISAYAVTVFVFQSADQLGIMGGGTQ